MRWPGAAAYMEAVQDPSSCFADPELASGTARLGPLGLPRAVSGNVATVFRVDSPDGRSWAVRCFVRPVEDEQRRYELIGDHLRGLGSSWRVGFDLQPRGIRVEGEWWPVLKMAWAPGEPLVPWVERHLWDPTALAYLAVRFADLAAQLRADGVAHGDLQHGNVLVAPGGDLRLVDYDGMYVPALAGWGPAERGHRDYQHPGRDHRHFGPGLDHFSSWVVYATLVALSADPLLWGRLDGGEESLLFRHHDFAEPARSAALAALDASDHPGLPRLAQLLRGFLERDPGAVPPLSLSTAPLPPVATAPSAVLRPHPAETGRAVADVAERRSLYEALRGSGAAPAATPAPPAPVAVVADLAGPRRVLARTGLVLAGVLAALAATRWAAPASLLLAPAAAVAVAGARLRRLYGGTAEVREARRTARVLAGPRRAAADAAAAVDRLARRRAQVVAVEQAAGAEAARAGAELHRREEAEVREVEERLQAALSALAAREKEVHRQEQDARAAALAQLQGRVVEAQLRHHNVVTTAALGVSTAAVSRLAMAGVRTAADFTGVEMERTGPVVVRRDGRRLPLEGVDPAQAAAVSTWRRQLDGVVQLKVPDSLPPETLAEIGADHERRRRALAREADAARAEARRQADAIRGRWQAEHEKVLAGLKATEADAARQRVELDRDLTRARKDATEAEWRLATLERGTAPVPELPWADYLRQVLGLGRRGGSRPIRP